MFHAKKEIPNLITIQYINFILFWLIYIFKKAIVAKILP